MSKDRIKNSAKIIPNVLSLPIAPIRATTRRANLRWVLREFGVRLG